MTQHKRITPAPAYLLVQPSVVDDNEEQRASGLVAVHHDEREAQWQAHRGVVLAVGAQVASGYGVDVEVGAVVHYTQNHVPALGLHLVPATGVVCWQS